MDFTFSIRFGKQPSADYQSVLAYASKYRMFIPAKEGAYAHVIETSNHEVKAKFDVFLKPCPLIGSNMQYWLAQHSMRNKLLSPAPPFRHYIVNTLYRST